MTAFLEKFGSTKLLLCLSYLAVIVLLVYQGRTTEDVLKLADAAKWAVLAYCGSRGAVEVAVALQGGGAPKE